MEPLTFIAEFLRNMEEEGEGTPETSLEDKKELRDILWEKRVD